MRSLVIVVICWVALSSSVWATGQIPDTIQIGTKTFAIEQIPMDQYWHFEDDDPRGRAPFPAFDVTSSANWRGYTAKWAITDGKLMLIRLRGQIGGKKVRNEEILRKRVPRHADWFSGRIFVPIGDLDRTRNVSVYVLQFDIKEGDVTKTTFHETFDIPSTRDGMPNDKPQPDGSR